VPNWKHYEKTKHYVINNNNYKAIVTMLGVEETVGGVLYKSFKGMNIELRCMNTAPGSTGKEFQFLLDGTRSHCGYYEGIFTQLIIGYNPNTGVYTGFNPVNTPINAIPDMISDIQFVDNNTNGIFDLIEFTFPQTGTHAQHNWANLGSSYQLVGTKFNTWWDGTVSSYVNPAPVSGNDIEGLILGGTSCNPMSCDACMRWVEPEAFEVDLTTNFLTCEEQLAMYAQSQVNHYLENCLEDKLDEIDQTYKQNCLYGIEDEFKLGYELRYGGYTLYYHDRAGNLIRSVSPQGVKTLTPAEIQDVRDFRKDPVANAGSYTLPGHDMVTNYKYNSLKQLVETQTPDGHYDVNTSSYYPSRTWYNKVGHTVLSQSAEQSLQFPQEFSFYCFDGYERLVRSGQLTLANGHTPADLAAAAWDTPYFPYASSSLTTTVAEVG
ncbi:MAG: hypothetical protein AAGB22_12950, partial [Bacteroidota bacterium]